MRWTAQRRLPSWQPMCAAQAMRLLCSRTQPFPKFKPVGFSSATEYVHLAPRVVYSTRQGSIAPKQTPALVKTIRAFTDIARAVRHAGYVQAVAEAEAAKAARADVVQAKQGQVRARKDEVTDLRVTLKNLQQGNQRAPASPAALARLQVLGVVASLLFCKVVSRFSRGRWSERLNWAMLSNPWR